MSSAPVVKICGVTSEPEVDALARLGVDYFGMIVGFEVDYAISTQRAAELVTHAGGGACGTIVTRERNVDALSRLIEDTGAPAIQLAGFTSARRIARLRQRFDSSRLTIMQVVHFQDERAVEQTSLGAYDDAGVDYFIVDRIGNDGALGSTGHTIDTRALEAFREQKGCAVPVLVAGGVDWTNVFDLMAASGAVGVDVSSSVRDGQGIDAEKVAALLEAMR